MSVSNSMTETRTLHRGVFWLAVVTLVFVCLPTITTALPLTELVEKAMVAAKDTHSEVRAKRAAIKTQCSAPDNLEQMFQDLNSQSSLQRFLTPASADGRVISLPANEKGTLIANTQADRTCPTSVTRNHTAPLDARSLCPYFFDVLRMPEGYYPATIDYAICRCADCIENSAYGCEPVSKPLAVLRPKGCLHGLQLYEEEIINVHVACTCAFRGLTVNIEEVPFSTTPAPSTSVDPNCGQECF